MGRPLNKKYMGNRNIGSTATTDNGIGGEGVASVTIAGTNNNYIAVPTATFANPTLPGGVTATAGTITMTVKSVAITNGGGSYADETVVTLGNGSLPAGSGTVDGTYTTRASFRIKSIDGDGAATSIELVDGGAYTVLAYNGSTAVSAPGSTITEMYTTGGAGNNLRVAITWGVLSVAVSEKGSGYVSAPAITMVGNATKTAVLTTDSGYVGSSTNQENAILAYAYIGGSLRLVDLVKQISTKRYKVRYNGTNYTARIRYDAIADGSAGYTAAEGVELNMIAIDGSSGTYLVRKLYNRTCTLKSLAINNNTIGITNNTAGTVFTDGKQYKWTFGTATSDTVKIQNA